ncbi:hypothetical protein AWB77_00509 [Caballeronia fortuita]|uniref:Uncharacterized protein n=1 Tax=Caballeronia fortuita TaxID=1777138 RepID=A0A157ZBH8_9BURK|nr:hypothetical protein [Caballeronia fortuita]SAK42905.1 hypothetical protein AWB77_00509 [Caballeronia fortuita]
MEDTPKRAERLKQLDLSIGKTRQLIAEHAARAPKDRNPYHLSSDASLAALEDSLDALQYYRKVLTKRLRGHLEGDDTGTGRKRGCCGISAEDAGNRLPLELARRQRSRLPAKKILDDRPAKTRLPALLDVSVRAQSRNS